MRSGPCRILLATHETILAKPAAVAPVVRRGNRAGRSGDAAGALRPADGRLRPADHHRRTGRLVDAHPIGIQDDRGCRPAAALRVCFRLALRTGGVLSDRILIRLFGTAGALERHGALLSRSALPGHGQAWPPRFRRAATRFPLGHRPLAHDGLAGLPSGRLARAGAGIPRTGNIPPAGALPGARTGDGAGRRTRLHPP